MGTIKCCKGCSKRYIGCHSECPEYIGEKAVHDEQKAKNYKEQLIKRRLDDQMFHGIAKRKKYIGKGK